MMRTIEWVQEVQDWNAVRDNLRYTSSLEYAMLDEELEEFMEAAITGDKVGEADALADILVVATGALFKLCEGDPYKFDDIMLAVTAANNTKSSEKNEQGKITKPADFVGPESMIEGILGDKIVWG